MIVHQSVSFPDSGSGDLRPAGHIGGRGRHRRWRVSQLVICGCLIGVSTWIGGGCGLLSRRYASPDGYGSTPVPNPLVVSVADPEFTWLQIVDMVDDYFDIAEEQQPREVGGILMEGRIRSKPRTGATLIEPLLRDSTPGYERWHSTLQSIRRTAFVRVVPTTAGFQIGVEVHKELEDVSQPEYSSVGQSARRHDGSLVAFDGFQEDQGPVTLGWISLGRDKTLEDEMLQQLYARLFENVTPPDASHSLHRLQ